MNVEIILGIDTSSDYCSVCLYRDGLFFSHHESLPRQHAQKLLPIIDRLLSSHQTTLQQLTGIVFGRGPGSFTGIRIGASVAEGLALGLNIPVYPVSNLTALALQLSEVRETWVMPCIDARMDEVYCCLHQVDEFGIPVPVETEKVIVPENLQIISEVQSFVGVGSGWLYLERFSEYVKSNAVAIYPDISVSAECMIKWVLAVNPPAISADMIEPVYLRDKVTWDNKPPVGSL
ncbi:metal-dependent protease-like protein, putative molecular chaperone [Gynuella sunshinyii YC6258]|uniref:tRNA threonylcarbamoyladenosine biosynthesis protein TsaB n=1 Tax=Gynuella sunshinyii YC6258 TaxID=1445510 RepID=A0A0C5VB02_9GAMM|nr:metal-dependent protease-like protein, putative molecular chaperone [Gynuella sunshinyii YC6258]